MPKLWSHGGARQPPPDPPAPTLRSSFKTALEHIAVTDVLLSGIHVWKVTAKGRLEPAILKISRDKFSISVLPRLHTLERVRSSGGNGLKRPGILSRVRSNGSVRATSIGSVGSGSLGGSTDGLSDAGAMASVPQAVVDIGSIDRIQSGQNTLLFEKARYVAPRFQGSVVSSFFAALSSHSSCH